jgi:hypothetical protein
MTLKIEATCSFEMSVDFQRTTRRYIPEDGILNFKFYTGWGKRKESKCGFVSDKFGDYKVYVIIKQVT